MKLKVTLTALITVILLVVVVDESGCSEVYESGSDLRRSSNDQPEAPDDRNRILPERAKKSVVIEPDASGSDSDSGGLQTNESGITGSGVTVNDQDRMLLAVLREALGTLEGVACRGDLNWTLDAISRREPWAIAMLDASTKSTSGLEQGDVFQLGHFDQCMDIDRSRSLDQTGIIPQYCLANVHVEGYRVRTLVSRNLASLNGTKTLVHWGVCVPASCSDSDVVQLLQSSTGHRDVSIPARACHRNTIVPTSTVEILYACVILLFGLLVAFSTVYHVRSMYGKGADKESTIGQVMRSFSVVENLRKLVQDSKDDHGLGCINGIKALAMFFILGSHALLFIAGGATYNPGFHGEQTKLLRNAFLLNSPLLVDTFLLLSGFLFARLLLIELDKRHGKVNFVLLYIFRYIRLTPAYAAIMALYATWLPRLGSGPLWDQRMLLEQSRCQASWWLNALYINNYIGTDRMCMFQSWYLATDSQLFVLAPLLLYPLWKFNRRTGLMLIGLVATVSVLVPFFVTYFDRLDPSMMIFTDEIADVQANYYFTNVYVKTHMRATGYVFGILAGYLAHWMQQKNISIGKRKLFLFWTASIVSGTVSMFGISAFYNSTGTGNYLYNALYAAFHRLGWSASNGWLVLACVTGHAGSLKKFLSVQALVPISRLTYCAYLTNGLVELYFSASRRVPMYASVPTMTAATLSHIFITFLLALGLCLVFESPIHGIEKILLRRHRPQPSADPSAKEDKLAEANNSTSGSINTQSTGDEDDWRA